MRRVFTLMIALSALTAVHARKATVTMDVTNVRLQTITGFGAASCDGAMKPYGTDTKPAELLYGPDSEVGLNIMRMEISPSFEGDGWGDYDWNGSLPSAKIVKERGGIVFGTPWSPPGEYKTNGVAQGGKVNDKDENDPQNQRGKLRKDCYPKFFPWLNSFLEWMHDHGVDVDAVSVQNEPDWWVNYSGCLYEPSEQLELVKNYAHLLDREKYNGVRLISAEPLGFRNDYSNTLLNDEVARNQVDIIAGHIYGHPPLQYIKPAAVLAKKYGKEVWMTEHSVSDGLQTLPEWDDQLEFAREVNECLQSGCTGYIYWYMRAHWAFVSTGESKYGSKNARKNKLLPRAYVYSHFAKNVTGSTLLQSTCSVDLTTNAAIELSAFIKGDSLIVMAINSGTNDRDFTIRLNDTPFKVNSGEMIISWGNESFELCQKEDLVEGENLTTKEAEHKMTVELPAKSVVTYIFHLDPGSSAIEQVTKNADEGPASYYDLQGRRLDIPHGLCIERHADGTSRKVFVKD